MVPVGLLKQTRIYELQKSSQNMLTDMWGFGNVLMKYHCAHFEDISVI